MSCNIPPASVVWALEGVEVGWAKLPLRKGFRVPPHLWFIERTFAWLSRWRRLDKD